MTDQTDAFLETAREMVARREAADQEAAAEVAAKEAAKALATEQFNADIESLSATIRKEFGDIIHALESLPEKNGQRFRVDLFGRKSPDGAPLCDFSIVYGSQKASQGKDVLLKITLDLNGYMCVIQSPGTLQQAFGKKATLYSNFSNDFDEVRKLLARIIADFVPDNRLAEVVEALQSPRPAQSSPAAERPVAMQPAETLSPPPPPASTVRPPIMGSLLDIP